MLTNLALAALVAFAGPSASTPTATALLSLSVSGSVVRDGVTAGNDNTPATTTLPDSASSVQFETKDKQLLSGTYYQPRRRKGSSPAPAVLLIHDAGQTREDLETIATYLNKKGFAVLTVDLRGHGESATDVVNFESSDEKAQTNLWALSTRDVDAAAGFLLEQHGVHATNLSIMGIGAGASLAVRRAMDDENVRAVVLVDPQPRAFGYDLAAGVADLGGLPTMIITPKASKNVAERVMSAAHGANGGLEYVTVATLRAKPGKTLSDKRLKSAAAAWLRDQAMPRK